MKKILLHIGTGKTGSSSIQASLTRATRDRTLGSIAYFRPQSESNNFIVALYRSLENIFPVIASRQKEPAAFDVVLTRYRAEFSAFLEASEWAIVSAETLAGLEKEEVRQLKNDLERAGYGEVLVVVYIRDPRDHYLSRLQQLLKTSTEVLDPRAYDYRIKKKITTWSDSYGRNLMVRPFDKDSLKDGCVVSDFLSIVGQFFGVGLEYVKPFKINESLSTEGMVILNLYRTLFHAGADSTEQYDVEKLIAFLQRSKKSLPQTAPSVRPTISHLIASNHAAELDWLRHTYSINFPTPPLEKSNLEKMPLFAGEIPTLYEILDDYNLQTVRRLLLTALKEALADDESWNDGS